MAGVDLTTGKTLLGHKGFTMTLRYSHLAPAHIQSALTILDAALRKRKRGQPLQANPLICNGGPSQN